MLTHLFSFQADRFLMGWGVVLWVILLFNAPIFLASKRGRLVFWFGIVGGGILGIALTLITMFISLPHGLSATYYGNASWRPSDMKLERYFADGKGGRVDRFIDFHPNDFNVEYQFSGRPFSVVWEGTVFVPFDRALLTVRSNFDTWLALDGQASAIQVAAPKQIDIGTAAARLYLRTNKWSFDERVDATPPISYAWAIDDDPEIVIGIDEIADYELHLRCFAFAVPGKPAQTVRVSLEKHEIGNITLRADWQTYTLPIPAALIEKVGLGSQRLIFEFSALISPSEMYAGSTDSRKLAAAFDTIELRRVTPAAPIQTASFITLERGLHAIKLQARSMLPDPFIQLLWQDDAAQALRIVPADHLFPNTLPTTEIASKRLPERWLLGIAIFYKSTLLVLWIGLCFRYLVRPFAAFIWRKEAAIPLGIGLCALAIRIAFLLEMRTLDPDFYFPTPGSDHSAYVFMSRGFFRGYWPNLTHQPFYFSPLIAFYMIGISTLFGDLLTNVRIITALLGAADVVLVYVIAKRIFSQTVAFIAAALFATNSVLIFYDISLLSDPLVVFLNLCALWLMLQWNERLAVRATIVLGIVLGLTALSRGTIALLMPLFFLWTLKTGAGRLSQKISHLALLCIITALTILPVTIRNYVSNDRHSFVPTNTAGDFVLWANLNPSSNGMGGYNAQAVQAARDRIRREGGSFGSEVWRYITEQPVHFMQLEFLKLKLFLRGYEVCDNWPYYIFRYVSPILRLPWLNFVIIAPLGIVGMLCAYRHWKTLIVLYGFIAVQLFSALIFNAASRYRLPVIPAFSIFAAYGIWVCACYLRQKRWAKAGLLFGLFVVMYLAFNYPDAARFYQQHEKQPMPFARVLRYWDLFYTW